VAVLVRDPSATTPVDVSLKHNRRAHYLSQPASESHPTPRDFGDPIAAWAAKSSARALSLVKWVSATG